MKRLILTAALTMLALASMVQASPTLVVVNGPGVQVPNAGPWPVIPVHAPFVAGPNGQEAIGADEAPPAFPNNIPQGTKGYAGTYLLLVDNAPGAPAFESVSFMLMGHGDAQYNNQFRVFANQADLAARLNPLIDWTIQGTPMGTAMSVNLPVGVLLPFLFTADGTPFSVGNNGADNQMPCGAGNCSPAFGVFDVSQTLLNQGSAFWLGFTDGGVANDYDQQDMVIRVAVPEPGSLSLVAAGLICLVALARRKTRIA